MPSYELFLDQPASARDVTIHVCEEAARELGNDAAAALAHAMLTAAACALWSAAGRQPALQRLAELCVEIAQMN